MSPILDDSFFDLIGQSANSVLNIEIFTIFTRFDFLDYIISGKVLIPDLSEYQIQ